MEVSDYYQRFSFTGYTFEEMVGDPEQFTSALGRVIQTFNVLDSQLAAAIALLMGVKVDVADMVTAEMSFANKLNLFASLVRYYTPEFTFNVGKFEQLEMLRHLTKLCATCEDLRNRVVHSSWESEAGGATRRKITAKARQGLIKQSEKFTPGMLIDIGDFNIYAAESVVEFFLVIDPPLNGYSELGKRAT